MLIWKWGSHQLAYSFDNLLFLILKWSWHVKFFVCLWLDCILVKDVWVGWMQVFNVGPTYKALYWAFDQLSFNSSSSILWPPALGQPGSPWGFLINWLGPNDEQVSGGVDWNHLVPDHLSQVLGPSWMVIHCNCWLSMSCSLACMGACGWSICACWLFSIVPSNCYLLLSFSACSLPSYQAYLCSLIHIVPGGMSKLLFWEDDLGGDQGLWRLRSWPELNVIWDERAMFLYVGHCAEEISQMLLL